MKNRILVGVFLLILPTALLAQTFQPFHRGMNNWYFGSTTNGLKFNRVTNLPTIINNKIALGTGGSATATDATNANLLFYTDGNNVYDANNLLMPNGSGLLGNPASNQSVAICPVPGQPNKYFIFSNSANNTTSGSVTYDVVDMSQLGNSLFPSTVPLGDLEFPYHNTMGLNTRAEAMMVVPHSNGINYWLLTQTANSQSYTATLINAASYNITHTGTFNSTNTTPLGLVMSASHFAYYDGGPTNLQKRVAVAPTTANTDAIILNFNNTSGAYSPTVTPIVNSASGSTNNQAIYDIEWSGDGHYVYYSVFGDETAAIPVAGDVFQFDFVNQTTTLASALPAPVFRSYGLQLAPDSSIYHLYQNVLGGPFLIGKITDPDSVAADVNYLPAQFAAVPNWNALQFSAVMPLVKPAITVTFISTGTCQNTPTSFYPTVTPIADSLVWDFGDGTPPLTAWSPVYTYQNPGTFNAQVTAYYQGQPQLPATINPVTINPFPLTLRLPTDTTACTFEFPPPKGTSGPPQFRVRVRVSGGSASSFVWSNGDNTDTLFPDSAGYYYVVVGNGSGCSTYAGVNVKEYNVSDQRFNTWYFGNKAGIDFNKSPAVALGDGAMNAPEGCSAISDRNGEILFYTDGDNVYDQTHALIATGIGGKTNSTQSALIVPVPGDETLYYIFTTEAKEDYLLGNTGNVVYYSLFDLKQNSGLGAIVQQKIPLYTGSTERLASPNNGSWLITHEYGNNSFRCYQITPAGLGKPVITSIGSDHSFNDPTLAEGYMKVGANGATTIIAVPLSIPGTSNSIEFFDFDNATGILSNLRTIDLGQANGQVYGIEFAGNKVMATIKGPPSFIREMYFDFQGNPQLILPASPTLGPLAQELGAMQVGPNNQIYFAINGSATLGTVLVNPDTLQLSTYNMTGFTLAAGTTSTLGLPSFVQQNRNGFGGPSMFVSGVCFGTPMDYIATPTDPIDTFLWAFGDGGTDNQIDGQHSYGVAGTYTVTLQINNRCLIHDGIPPYTFSQNVNIVNPPAAPTIPAASAICIGAVVLDAESTGSVTGLTYSWSTSETTRQISVSTPGLYSVTITDATGCTSNGSTNMQDARPKVNLGPDRTICEGSFVIALNAQNSPPAFSHVWTLDGVANGNTTSTQPVSTTTPGTDTYQVTVTNIATNCVTVEEVEFIITESPAFSLTAINTAVCGTASGQINLTISALTQTTQPPIHTFTYFGTGITTTTGRVSGVVYNFPGLAAGNYSIRVSDEISGCTVSRNASISDPANTLAAGNPTTCSTVAINANTNANTVPVAGNFTFRVFDSGGVQVGTGTRNTANFNTNLLPPGTYTLQVTKSGCVTAVNNIVITQDPQITFTATPNACTSPQTITASSIINPTATYAWTGPNIVGGAATATVSVNPGVGTFNYTATASEPGFCNTSQVIPITVAAAATPSIDPFDPCLSPVVLAASPSTGGYSYQWYKNGVLDLTFLGQQISLTPADNGDYQVEIISPTSGCAYQSAPPVSVTVIGPVTAAISSTPACNDGTAFIISSFTNNGNPTYSWFRDTGTGFTNIGVNTPTTSQTTAGIYKVNISEGVCSAEATITLILGPVPIGTLPSNAIICDDPENADVTTDHIDLDPGAFAAYNWFMKKTDQSIETSLNFTDQVYRAEKKGIYRVELTNTFGCKASDITDVENDCVPKIYAPNAFKPSSGVAENKDFFALTFFVTDENFKVFVYNRWGELVYQADDRYFKWNGGYNNNEGNPLPSGAYAYIIQYVSSFRPDEGVQEKRGGVMLLR